MFFALLGVFLSAFFLQIFGFPITISNERIPQANQEGTVVLTQDPFCFYLASLKPRVTPGRGHERRSAASLVAGPKPPILFGISGIPHIDTLCGEVVLHTTSSDAHVQNDGIGTNGILARSANFELLENLNDKDLLEEGRKDITIRADSGGPIILNKVKNGRNTTTGGVTINGGHGSTAISGNAKIKVGHGGAALSGNATTGKNGTATSGKVTINGGSGGTATSGDATTGDDGSSTSGSATNGGSDGSAISGNAKSGDNGNSTSGNAISSGSGGSAVSGDATVYGASTVDGGPVSSAAATSVETASATASPTTSTTSSRHHAKAPVIIGSTIGSFALVVILVLLAILWRRRKSRSREGNTSEDKGLRTDSRPGSTRTSTVSSSSAYPSPFEPIRRGGDFPLPSGDGLPQTRMLSPSRDSYWPPREGNQSMERENLRRPAVEVVETTYGASPPPSYLSPR